MARRRQQEEGGGDSWLNTYADMVTLLLTFFAVLISMSSVDQEKFNAFIRSFSALPQEVIDEIVSEGPVSIGNSEEPADAKQLQELFDYLAAYASNDSTGVDIKSVNDDIIFIRFDSALLFYPDSYALLPESKPLLEYIGDGLKAREADIKMINIIGHTAEPPEVELTTSGWMLSGERAGSVAAFLEYEKAIDPKKMVILGYGKHFPIADNSTETTRKLNRRVEMIVVGNNADTNFDLYEVLGEVYNQADNPQSGGEKLFEAYDDTTAPDSTAQADTTPSDTTPAADDASQGGTTNADTQNAQPEDPAQQGADAAN